MYNNLISLLSASLLCSVIFSEVNFAASFSFVSISKSQHRIDTTTAAAALKAHLSNQAIDRQSALKNIAWIPNIWSQGINMAEAKVSIKPNAAFKSLVDARAELTASKKFLATKDYEGMKDFLSDSSLNINNYEENASVLLASKQLDAESKKEIGTIRRYGVGADVIIMYGGVKAELEEEETNFSTLSKSLQRAMDSLDEVIAICKSNGF
jgi:hypothetical protein